MRILSRYFLASYLGLFSLVLVSALLLMTVVEMLERNPKPTAQEVRDGLEGNICRCTGYQNIVKATLAAAEAMGG